MNQSELKKNIHLSQLQNWMQEVFIKRGDLFQKLAEAEQKTDLTLTDAIKETDEFKAIERINIYASGYILRLVEALKAEYPLLCKFMGSEVFEGFAKAYIVIQPSRFSSLYGLGAMFPEFLEKTQPHGANNPEQLALFQVPSQLARFERAQAEVLLAQGLEEQDRPPTPAAADFFAPDNTKPLQVAPCVRILQLDYLILAFSQSLHKTKNDATPQQQENWVALSRRDYKVISLQITEWQASLLRAFSEPTPLYEALDSIPSADIAQTLLWLPTALDFRLLYYPQNQASLT